MKWNMFESVSYTHLMAVMHEAKNDKEHPDWFVSDDEEYVRTHIEEQGFVLSLIHILFNLLWCDTNAPKVIQPA